MKQIDQQRAGQVGTILIGLLDARAIDPFRFNRRCTFYRVGDRGQSFVIKSAKTTPPDPHTIASLRHEYELLHGLNLPGIVHVVSLVQTESALAMVMEDVGQQSLAEQIHSGALSIAQFWDIAQQLAETVAGLHGVRIVHRNLNPANIVWNGESGKATLVDFGIAITLSTLAVDSASPAHVEGHLAYISPEQTGRTGRSVDSRSDLYSLGATFYALLTGAPPFTEHDPIELVHAHLARRPKPPHLVNAKIPQLLSLIILKLLEKEPERRYMTAEALASDLRKASAQWFNTGAVAPFPLAQDDVPRELYIPEKLYGRDQETAMLASAFGRACAGQRELVLITGEPGIGKTALVSQLAQPVAERGGYFMAGKFDQLQRSVPYAGLVQAFRMLIRQLLTETDLSLSVWREQIQAMVAPNGQILIDLIPEIEAILGAQSPVPALGPVESKHRFSQVFTSIVRVFATPDHPFTIFLDDLQWADGASLQLIEQWMGDDKNAHLLIVGAYRDNEVGPSFALALAELRGGGRQPTSIHLGNLDRVQVGDLIAETLNQSPATCVSLTELVLKKTAGNPFFIKRLLHMLHGEAMLRFVPDAGAWQWDMAQIERMDVSDNVLDLMIRAIDQLPEATQLLLQVGACIGHRFNLGTLAEVTGRSRTGATDELWPALEDGLLLPLHDAYKAPRRPGPLDQDLAELPVILRFVHDRVQQAAYSMLTAERKQALHVDIGRQLLEQGPIGESDARLFEVVDQFNLGEALLNDPAERLAVAQLNLLAGRKAKTSAAYDAAFDYLTIGKRLLPGQAWDSDAELTRSLYRELAECAYLTGRHDEAERLLEVALEHAASAVSRADLYSLRVLAATVAADWAGALRWGREGLAVFGHEWPLEHLAEANEAEASAVMNNLGAGHIADLLGRPEVRNEETRACMRLLSLLGPPAYFSGSAVLTFLVTRSANLSLLHGPSEYSAYAYVFYGALHNARTGDYAVGYAFGQLALALAKRFGNRVEESRTLEVFGLVVHAWRAALRDSLPLMKEGHRAGVESGELAYAAFNLCGILINGLPGGLPLAELLADADAAIEFSTRYKNRTSIEICLPFRQFARTLRGGSTGSFSDDSFDEARFIEQTQGNQTAMGQFWVARLQAAYLFGDYAMARHSAEQAAKCIAAGILGMITCAEYAFYAALTAAATCAASPEHERDALRAEVVALRQQIANWALHCPENFLHKQQLVDAELERIAGSPWKAMELYGEAVERAQRTGFVQDAALGNELAAAMFFFHGQPALARVYLRAATACYRKWGATAKVLALENAHPRPVAGPDEQGAAIDARAGAAHEHDALGLIRASQLIAAETVPERLFEQILQIVVQVAGAQSAMLLWGDAQALRVRARVTAEARPMVALVDMALAECRALPQAVARYVMRLQEPLVLADAISEGPFAADLEVQALGLRSVLCVPLTKNLRLVGLLYLENKAMASAFTAQRVEVIQSLAAQAAISLENGTLLRERERAAGSARFLASAGTALAESLDYAKTLERIAALAVPTFADWCLLDLVDDDGGVDRVQIAVADPAHAELAARLKRFPVVVPGSGDVAAELVEELNARRLQSMAHDEAHHELLKTIAPRSMIVMPLFARGRTLGALSFLSKAAARRYDEADLDTARKFADRCALAIDNALLYGEAQQAIQVREDFLAVASHELRTPLMPLQLQIHLIERRLPALFENEESAAWLTKSMATLQRQGKRLERLVNELLDISRISGGQLQFARGPVNLARLAHDVVERMAESGEATQSGEQLTVTCLETIIGHWDRARIEQVISSLLSNAFKYGEGKPVSLILSVDGPNAVIEVRDQGLGIEAAHLQRIFGRFERAVSARNYGGLGLGLYIVSEIVTAMGGSIQVASKPGEGSIFTVILPLSSPGTAT